MKISHTTMWKLLVLAAVVGVAATLLSSAGTAAEKQSVTLVWWHNVTQGPGVKLYKDIASEFQKKNPNITLKVVPLQNEQFKTKIPIALQSDDPPDVFQSWGGGGLVDQQKAGKVTDLTKYVAPWIKTIGGSAAGWQVNGKQYAVPYSVGVVGFWYNKQLFKQAGVSSAPKTWPQFLAAISKLKNAGITPLSVGGKDTWTEAFYWDYLAVKLCSKSVMQQSAVTYSFKDPCWVKAGKYLQQLLDAEPFQDGFLATPAQQTPTSAAGLMANGKVAMELQGHWDPGTMAALTPDQKVPGFLGWFPFPNVPGSKAVPGSLLGGGDGYACSSQAPQPACSQLLAYINSPSVQRRIGSTGFGLPVRKGTQSSVKDPNLGTVLKFRTTSPFIQLYLDQAYSAAIGQALNTAIAKQFAGKATPAQVVAEIAKAAKKK
jgi:raffinose/stachyose/melibiose transport system substrate-binding protein